MLPSRGSTGAAWLLKTVGPTETTRLLKTAGPTETTRLLKTAGQVDLGVMLFDLAGRLGMVGIIGMTGWIPSAARRRAAAALGRTRSAGRLLPGAFGRVEQGVPG